LENVESAVATLTAEQSNMSIRERSDFAERSSSDSIGMDKVQPSLNVNSPTRTCVAQNPNDVHSEIAVLKSGAASLASGLVKLAQCLGLHIGFSPVADGVACAADRSLGLRELLDWESQGGSLAARIERSWVDRAPARSDTLFDLVQRKADSTALASLRIAVTELEAGVQCARSGLKEEWLVPSRTTEGSSPSQFRQQTLPLQGSAGSQLQRRRPPQFGLPGWSSPWETQPQSSQSGSAEKNEDHRNEARRKEEHQDVEVGITHAGFSEPPMPVPRSSIASNAGSLVEDWRTSVAAASASPRGASLATASVLAAPLSPPAAASAAPAALTATPPRTALAIGAASRSTAHCVAPAIEAEADCGPRAVSCSLVSAAPAFLRRKADSDDHEAGAGAEVQGRNVRVGPPCRPLQDKPPAPRPHRRGMSLTTCGEAPSRP